MLDSAFLEILCCPETRQSLKQVSPGEVEAVNQQILKGSVKNRAGDSIRDPIDALLVREDGKFGYAVRKGIPIMLTSEALVLTES